MLINSKGSSLIELVVGLSLIILIVSALAISTATGIQSSQFSKNQIQATKLAQEGIEKVRLIKTKDYGVCLNGQSSTCSIWKDLWVQPLFGNAENICTNCTFIFSANCNTAVGSKQVCLQYSGSEVNLGGGFKQKIIILDEGGIADQKKVISRISWTDSSGTHKSELISVLSKRTAND